MLAIMFILFLLLTIVITLFSLWIFKLQLRLETTTDYLKILAKKVDDLETEMRQILEEHMAEITDIKESIPNQ